MGSNKLEVLCDCTTGCSKCGRSHSVIDHTRSTLTPAREPSATSVRVGLEMIVGSVEHDPVTNDTRTNYFVKFSTENGHAILYPREGLKETVLRWIAVEEASSRVNQESEISND